jgi:hypothetical protein
MINLKAYKINNYSVKSVRHLSPIPEITFSNCITPESSPIPITCKPKKFLSPPFKILKPQKISKRNNSIATEKKNKKIQKTIKKKSSESIQNTDSNAIYLRDRRETIKIFRENNKNSSSELQCKSLERSGLVNSNKKLDIKANSYSKHSGQRLSDSLLKPSDRNRSDRLEFETKKISDAITKYKKKRIILNTKLPKVFK